MVSKPADLAQRIFGRGAAPPTAPKAHIRAKRNMQGLTNALSKATEEPASTAVNVRNNNHGPGRGDLQVAGAAGRAAGGPAQRSNGGLTIRGLAGPHIVEVRGFAPGTTAGDIEEAIRSKGISVHSCRLLQSSPKVIADILCDSKEDADRIGEFHGQWVSSRIQSFNLNLAATRDSIADVHSQTDYDARSGQGYQLYVMKSRPAPAPTGYRSQPAQNNGILVDGSMGFDPLPVENSTNGGNGGLYSDQLVATSKQHNHQSNNNTTRRGRGFRGGRGGNR